MAHRNVELLIGRLATDPLLRRRFEGDPREVLRELDAQGYELSTIEVDALASIDPAAIRHFAGTLDPRLRKADRHTTSTHE
jgi:hypothetical protein